MGITYRKNDDLEKMLENFATLPKLEGANEPDPKQTKKAVKKETDA